MMEFSSAGASQMIMQGYESASGELFGFQTANPNPNPGADHWQVDGYSIRPTIQGLSLSLSNPMASSHQEQLFLDDGGARLFFQQQHQQQQQPFLLKRSKYVIPAQELLNEFCNLGGIMSTNNTSSSKKKEHQWEEGGPSSLYSMDLAELQKRKAKLLSMLEEVKLIPSLRFCCYPNVWTELCSILFL